MIDPRLYLVTEPHPRLADVVADAVRGGATLVQLRDKTAAAHDRSAGLDAVRAVTAARGVPLVVNDDVELAARADGVHVGLDDVSPREARAALGPDAIVGWSVNDLAQLDDHEQIAACTYLAASPVFATGTKPDHTAPWGLAGVRRLADRSPLPVVAIGGIDAANAGQVIAAGAAGVCVVSAICRADDPFEAARALRAAVDERRRDREGAR